MYIVEGSDEIYRQEGVAGMKPEAFKLWMSKEREQGGTRSE